MKYLITAVAVIILALLFEHWRHTRADARAGRFQTATVKYGDITQTVTATGTLNPVVLVNVGTQVSGTVQKLHTDFNSHVKAGQVLLTLDPTLLKAQVVQDQANLASAEATLSYAQSNESRIRELYKQDYETKADLDQAVEARESGVAAVDAAKAQMLHDQTNLNFTVIRSPVDGTVINREVDVGQTVAASFQTPTLFTIAKDLHQMQIDTTVDEADVGQARIGQPVTFTVDAYPDKVFKAAVKQVRLNATNTQNVVTYDVVIAVDNADLILLPGMTAYVTIQLNSVHHVLIVPNAALRMRLASHAPATEAGTGNPEMQTLYLLTSKGPRPVHVKIGITDNQNTQIISDRLSEGDTVIVGVLTAAKGGQMNMAQGMRIF
ncbi:MAG TPA: efflux RND transporter periplasmic adaptor subunit [Gammaproteobacteria bacterium]|nr:efflux RND transporter periplasmic adaptor subunit [Gammaproteobacteria bacterium]